MHVRLFAIAINQFGCLSTYARAPLPPMYASSLFGLHLLASRIRSSLLAEFPTHCWHSVDSIGAPGAHDAVKKLARSSSEDINFLCFNTCDGAAQPAKSPLYPLWQDFLPFRSSEINSTNDNEYSRLSCHIDKPILCHVLLYLPIFYSCMRISYAYHDSWYITISLSQHCYS